MSEKTITVQELKEAGEWPETLQVTVVYDRRKDEELAQRLFGVVLEKLGISKPDATKSQAIIKRSTKLIADHRLGNRPQKFMLLLNPIGAPPEQLEAICVFDERHWIDERIAEERVDPYDDNGVTKYFRKGGSLENFNLPDGPRCFADNTGKQV